MNPKNNGQASVVAFNPYGQYKSCTFTIANKSEYWDEVDRLVNLGERKDHHFKLNVIADQKLVKQIDVYNLMQPQTFTVPINNCHSLVFWLEDGPTRSGQFVLYDMTVSKKQAAVQPPIPSDRAPEQRTSNSAAVQPSIPSDRAPEQRTSNSAAIQPPIPSDRAPEQRTSNSAAVQQINALKSNSINANKQSNTLAPKK